MRPTTSPWTAKFTRNPKFTPASLTPAKLTRVERLARLTFYKHHRSVGESFYELVDENGLYFLFNSMPKTCARYSLWELVLTNPDAERYYRSCYAYLLAIARNNGFVGERMPMSRKGYAMAAGYYG